MSDNEGRNWFVDGTLWLIVKLSLGVGKLSQVAGRALPPWSWLFRPAFFLLLSLVHLLTWLAIDQSDDEQIVNGGK